MENNYELVYEAPHNFIGGGRSKLLSADDHLLFAKAFIYSERYYRFYLKDIRAMTVSYTAQWTILNGIAGLISFIFIWPFLYYLVLSPYFSKCVSFGIIWGGLSLPLLVNVLKGRTAVLTIHTKHGPTKTVNGRVRHLDRLVKRCAVLIDSVQENVDQHVLMNRYNSVLMQGEPLNDTAGFPRQAGEVTGDYSSVYDQVHRFHVDNPESPVSATAPMNENAGNS